jgi:hypothetical protein
MSNLRQENIKLLVASWAPLRYYLVAQLKFQSSWASGRPLISVPGSGGHLGILININFVEEYTRNIPVKCFSGFRDNDF